MTLAGQGRQDKRDERWYGTPTIDVRVDPRLAIPWAKDYLANRSGQFALTAQA